MACVAFSKSGVSIRTIQAYESGAKDINKASGMILYKLARALDCYMEDLLDTEAIEKEGK